MTSSKRIRSRLHKDQTGAAAVEFAIVASLFFMLVFGIIDFGFAFHSWNNAVNGAREGARIAAVTPGASSAAVVEARVRAATSTLDQSKLTVSVVCSHSNGTPATCGASMVKGDITRVIVNYDYDLITPLGSFVPGLGQTLNLHSQSESSFEGQ
jgi:Flp pilus assembly protein TadG